MLIFTQCVAAICQLLRLHAFVSTSTPPQLSRVLRNVSARTFSQGLARKTAHQHHTNNDDVLQGIEEAAKLLVGEIVKRDAARPSEPSPNTVNPDKPAEAKSGCC